MRTAVQRRRVRVRAARGHDARPARVPRCALGAAAVHGRAGQGRPAEPPVRHRARRPLGRARPALPGRRSTTSSTSCCAAAAATKAEFLPVLIAGIFLFGLSTAALGEAGTPSSAAKGLMLNSTFPRALLPVTSVYKSLRQFVLSASVFAVLFPLVGGKLGPGLFVLPVAVRAPDRDEHRHRPARGHLRRARARWQQRDDAT